MTRYTARAKSAIELARTRSAMKIIRAGTLIDGTGAPPVRDAVVHIDPSLEATFNDDVQRRDRFVDASWFAGGAALAAVAVGIALYYFDEPGLAGKF